MDVLIFGATGMIGRGVLRECLLDSDVKLVQTIGRTPSGILNPKLREVVLPDLLHYQTIEESLSGYEACFFCLGVSSSGMAESAYERVTFAITMAAAETLCRLNPGMRFVYISGAGADSSEHGRIMWARVKGKTENALLRLPFAGAYIFRPGFIEPLDGIQSRTSLYRIFYVLGKPLLPLLRMAFPNQVLTTRQIGLAMLNVARSGYPNRILESADIRAAAAAQS